MDVTLAKKVKIFEVEQKRVRKTKRERQMKHVKKRLSKAGKWFDRNIASEAEMMKRLKKL